MDLNEIGITRVIELQERAFEREIRELKSRCEADKDVAEFVRLIMATAGSRPRERNNTNDDYFVGEELIMFMWKISGMSIELSNEYHFSFGWAASLNSFIGNWFCDDAYFLVEKDAFGLWTARDDPEQNGFQDPRLLIEAAKDMAAYGGRSIENFSAKMRESDYVKKAIAKKAKSTTKRDKRAV